MADFKDKFVPLDSDFFGDGGIEDDSTTSPLSTLKENYINEKNLRLLSQHHDLEMPIRQTADISVNGNLRADFNWRTIAFIPVYLQPETQQILVTFKGEPVMDAFSELSGRISDTVNIGMALWRRSSSGFVREVQTDSRRYDGGEMIPLHSSQLILSGIQANNPHRLDLTNQQYEANTLRWLSIETRCGFSYDDGVPSPAATQVGGRVFTEGQISICETNRGGGETGICGTHGDFDGLSEEEMRQCIFKWQFTDLDDNALDDVDKTVWTQYVGRWERSFDDDQDQTDLMTPFPYDSDIVNLSERVVVTAHACYMPNIKSINVSVNNRPPIFAPNRYRVKGPRSMEPQRAVRGTDVVDHADMADHLMERWHPVYRGPFARHQGGTATQNVDDDVLAEENNAFQRFGYLSNDSDGTISMEIPCGVGYEQGEIEVQASLIGFDMGMHPDTIENNVFSGIETNVQRLAQPLDLESSDIDDDSSYVYFKGRVNFNVTATNPLTEEGLGGATGTTDVDLWKPSFAPGRSIQMLWPMMCFEDIRRGRAPFLSRKSNLDQNYHVLGLSDAEKIKLFSGNNNIWWDDTENTTGQNARLFNLPRQRFTFDGHDPNLPMGLQISFGNISTSFRVIPNQGDYPVFDDEDQTLVDLERYFIMVRDITVFVRGAK